MFIAELFIIARTRKQSKCPSTEEWIKKMWCVYTHAHTHNGIILSHKKGMKSYNLQEQMDWFRTLYAK